MPQMSKVELYAAIRRDHRGWYVDASTRAQVRGDVPDGAEGDELRLA
ncbi:hypothetical protein ACF06P_38360 [Streptomyces sp. NPDC015684]